MTTGKTLVSITDCVDYFANKGLTVDRATISRHVKKHGLSEGTRGRATLVDPQRVHYSYTNDFQRSIMSGEASGAKAKPAAPPAQRILPTEAPDEDNAPLPGPGTPERSAAELEKREKVRALRRANAEAEGQLIPVSEVVAALASAVGEQRTIWARMLQEFVETQAAGLKLDTSEALSLRVAVRDFLAAGQNAFAAEIGALIDPESGLAGPAGADFEALVAIATGQASQRMQKSKPDAA